MEKPIIDRRTILVDPRFQFLFLGYMILFSVVISAIVFYVGGQYFTSIFAKAIEMGLAKEHRFFEFLNNRTSDFTMYFSLACLFSTSALLAGGMFLSHRIAGPIYHLRKQLRMVVESGELKEIRFRNGDYFQDLAASYNEMVRSQNGTAAPDAEAPSDSGETSTEKADSE